MASSAGLVLFCLGADHVIFKWEERWLKLSYGVSLRAVSDSVVHGLVGGWCWANVLLLTSSEGLSWVARIGQVVLCIAMATAIDLDHFIEAKSFSIKVVKFTQNKIMVDLFLHTFVLFHTHTYRMPSACQSVLLLTTQL